MKSLSLFFITLFVTLTFFGCKDDSTVSESAEDLVEEKNDDPQPEPLTEEQLIHDRIGKFLAGIELGNIGNESPFDQEQWSAHSNQLEENWGKMESTRLTPMSNWVNQKINPVINDTLPLLYPYSGPDFLHANYLFPDASSYVMMALEPIGDLPDFSSMSQEKMDNYLKNINRFLRDIYRRSYFITKNMEGDVDTSAVNGILPVLYVFIERSDYQILNVERVGLSSSGEIVPKAEGVSKKLDGVRFSIMQNGSTKRKELVYWDCDISNSGFENTPELAIYLSKLPTGNAFMKSASYLMHYGTFSQMRELVMKKSEAILEDDTGIPYKYFKPAEWTPNLYGKYTKPIADFQARLWQEDLQFAYDSTDQYSGTLPFSLGYHWGDGVQNYMIYFKK